MREIRLCEKSLLSLAMIIDDSASSLLSETYRLREKVGTTHSHRRCSGTVTDAVGEPMIWVTAPRERDREPSARRLGLKLTESALLVPGRSAPAPHRGEGSRGRRRGRKTGWEGERRRKSENDVVERDEGKEGLGSYHRGPLQWTGCPGLRPLSLLGSLARGKYVGQGHRGGIGGLYYIYEALSKQSNNIDSAPRSDRPSRRTPSHGPPLGYVYTLPEGLRRPYSFHSCVLSTPRLFISFAFRFNARRMRSNRRTFSPA